LPSFRVDKITLTFPEYTGLAKQTFENQGEVRAVEGTQVSLTARCNANLERASFLPDGERPLAQRMKVDDNNPKLASIDFNLEWVEKNDDRRLPNAQPFSFYQIVSHDVDGQENRDIQNYPVSIVADLPPTIRWESAPDELVEIPLNEVLHLKMAAEDPDFSLRSASLFFAFHNLNEENDDLKDRTPPEPIELFFSSSRQQKADNSKGPTPYVGLNYISCEVSPEKLGLSVGDEVEYWAVAYDSKLPNPNSGVTERRIFAVVAPVANPNGINAESSEPDKEEEPSSSQNDESSGNGNNQGEQPPSNGSEQTDGNQSDSPENAGESNSSQTDNQDKTDGSSAEGKEENQNGENSSGAGERNNKPDETNKSTNGSNQSSLSDQEDQGKNEGTTGSNDANQNGSDHDGPNQNGSDQNDPNSTSSPSSESENSQQEASSPTSNNNRPSQTPQNVSPSEAFEKILDYINESATPSSEGMQEENETGQKTSASEQSNGGSSASNNENSTSDEDHSSETRQSDEREVAPDFDPGQDIPQSNEKRELPTRPSSQKPNPNAPSYQAENPDSIDANASRKQGKVDPNTNDFLGQNPNEDLPVTNNANKNANIVVDPMDQSQPVVAEAVDPKATEAKGNPNSDVSEAPYEIDQQQNDKAGRGNNSQANIGKSQLPEGFDGKEDFLNDENNARSQNDSLKKQGNEKNNNQNVDQSDEQSASNSNSSENSKRQRGGGGTGMGETESERQTLAPADSPKLQYAEQATNLVLEYLEDSLKNDVDRELLNELGWTEEQLRDFLKHWQKMRDEAGNGGKKEFESYLKALEETTLDFQEADPEGDVLSPIGKNKRNDKPFQNGSSNEASRIKTPDRLSERVRAFTQGVSQGADKR
ncbi:MAG: hypothetical protein J6X44_02070, partial [Thermoguttaceae bacterium]|nr:hypothetical protein [Thermoguttaceae bacterium]